MSAGAVFLRVLIGGCAGVCAVMAFGLCVEGSGFPMRQEVARTALGFGALSGVLFSLLRVTEP